MTFFWETLGVVCIAVSLTAVMLLGASAKVGSRSDEHLRRRSDEKEQDAGIEKPNGASKP